MSRMSRIIRLDKYLAALTLQMEYQDGEFRQYRAVMTTAQADATSKLSRLSGPQIIAARSECKQSGDADGYSSILSTVVFVLDKGLGTGKTEERENEQYLKLAGLADAALARIADDATSGLCNLLSGLELDSVDITPESSIFGGWCGYSIEISFRC